MRRKEFTIEDQAELEEFLTEESFGYLATAGVDGLPNIKPLNFVYTEGAVYFHGSRGGEKMKDLKRNNSATFAVAREFALIPSYFTDDTFACPATAFFKSVQMRGTIEVVEDLEEKARAFTAFMGKLQPEGGFRPFDHVDPDYIPRLKGVALLKLNPDEISAKFKFGQNMREADRDNIMTGLEQRDRPLDEETVRLMKKYCPAHKEN
ncbi:pyridoxamine 5'-phosphate oxidase family protein [Paenibacillus gansuensis]|uniref:Pyridoxamine 5'-phosphate oxidase family protein n=1 Tax=Paenibacillus gansuensis TaxID=306542 RepID=A0ABW5PBT4_9BACL